MTISFMPIDNPAYANSIIRVLEPWALHNTDEQHVYVKDDSNMHYSYQGSVCCALVQIVVVLS